MEDAYIIRHCPRSYIKTKELLSGEKKYYDNYPKYVVSMDDIGINHSNGIIHENIWDFIFDLGN